MPQLDLYSIFISHAWSHDEEYERLVNLLNSAPLFKWRNYSAPSSHPVVEPGVVVGKRTLTRELDNQIRPVNCVLIISGMYMARKEWIKKEINLAQKYSKPTVAVIPRGNERIPEVVLQVAVEVVGWETASIVEAIRKYAL